MTARINTLEERVGQQQLHRRKSGAALTSAGFKFQRYAELMTQVWRQARYEIALPPGVEGVCNAGLEFDLWHNVGSLGWGLEYVLPTNSKGYFPARIVEPLLASGRLHRIEGAPSFPRRVYLVESARATRSWTWYEAAAAASAGGPPQCLS